MDRRGSSGIVFIGEPNSAEELFANGMKRTLGLVEPPYCEPGDVLNLGAGEFRLPDIEGCFNLDKSTGWDAPDLIMHDTESVSVIHAYHFLEHLPGTSLRVMMEECERVLKVGGAMYICTPYARSDLAFQDIDHKTFFTEETWETFLNNPYYKTGGGTLRFRVKANFIAGVVGRNLGVFTQLVKE